MEKCKFCQLDNKGNIEDDWKFLLDKTSRLGHVDFQLLVGIYEKELVTSLNINDEEAVGAVAKIKYCPVCGRKL